MTNKDLEILKTETELAEQIIENYQDVMKLNQLIAFSLQFISYSHNASKQAFDDALKDSEIEESNLPEITFLMTQYHEKKISRMTIAFLLNSLLKIKINKSEKLQTLESFLHHYIEDEEKRIGLTLERCSQYKSDTAYKYCISWLYLAVQHNDITMVNILLEGGRYIH